MRIEQASRTTDQGAIEPAHLIEVVCAACGYDLDEGELEADTCSDCGQVLDLRRHVAIQVTTVPASVGGTLP